MDGDGHDDGLVVAELIEVAVIDNLGNGVEVDILQHGLVFGAVEVDFDETGFGIEEDALELGLGDGKEILFAFTIHDTGHFVFATESLSIFFPYVLAERTAQ
jgi:hypothetical protein